MSLKPEDRKEIFRKTAGTAIENSHGAIKQIWVALFAGGTFALINSFHTLMGCAGIFGQSNNGCIDFLAHVKIENPQNLPNFCILVSLYIIYVLTFYRFYVGNIRVFDMRYIEVVKFIALLDKKQARTDADHKAFFDYIDRSPRWESLFLIFKTLVIISLTIEINAPEHFMKIYFVLLCMDIIWMFFTKRKASYFRELFFDKVGLDKGTDMPVCYIRKLLCYKLRYILKVFIDKLCLSQVTNKAKDSSEIHTRLEMIFPSRSTEFWTLNNSIFFVFLAAVLVWLCFYDKHDLNEERFVFVIGAAVMLLNCFSDLWITWGFYNPQFGEAYGLLPVSPPDEQSSASKQGPAA